MNVVEDDEEKVHRETVGSYIITEVEALVR